MEKNYLNPDMLVEFEFRTEQRTKIHYHENIELLFVVNGSMTVSVERDQFLMGQGDMIVINANRNHSYESTEEILIARFVLSYTKISELMRSNSILFWCNSVDDNNDAYAELRNIIAKIFNQYLRDDNTYGSGKILLYSLYYEMLYNLVGNFLVTERGIRYADGESEQDDRLREIFDYLRINYRRHISLQDLASQLYISPAYVSKYIRRKCGNSFMDLLNSVRLAHAMEDLMYTDSSVIKIAMDNGFASIAAFNKVFKEAYHISPSEFRREKKKKDSNSTREILNLKEKIGQKVEAYLIKNPAETQLAIRSKELDVCVESYAYIGNWNHTGGGVINVGTALDLIKSSFQEQILNMKERIGFQYVRFWDIYNPELFIDIHAERGRRHFGQLDIVTDFLVKNRLKPYMELGFKPLKLLKNTQAAIKEISRDQDFESEQEMWDFYSDMMYHFIRRYGYEEVKKWYFEYWEKEGTSFHNLTYEFTPMAEAEHQRYFHSFDVIANALRSSIPEINIGGGGFPLQHYGEREFVNMLQLWKEHKELPDFISLSCYPYQQKKEGNIFYEKRVTDMDFVKHNVQIAKRAVQQAKFPVKRIHVSEYSMSLSNRNAMNDSLAKGAFLMQNMISCYGEAEVLGHWLYSDLYADYHDSQNLLFGGCGILTKNGIPKPAFYAFEFLNHLYANVIAKGKHYLITQNERGSLRIVCHNFKGFNYNYYMTGENEIEINAIPNMIDNKEHLTIHFCVNNVKNGSYVIKHNRINKENGSIQDEWNQLNTESELALDEMDYLKKVITAKMKITELDILDEKIEVDVQLEPNELQHLYISRK